MFRFQKAHPIAGKTFEIKIRKEWERNFWGGENNQKQNQKITPK
jgi:hypothetical protein